MEVKFYDNVEDAKLRFAVIAARYCGKWVFCKHKERDTFEMPGGHRESKETIEDAAKRELYEETGAVQTTLSPICVYSVTGKTRVNDTGDEMFGMLYYAEIQRLDKMPESEMEKVCLFTDLPSSWTYPLIQPRLIEKVIESGYAGVALPCYDTDNIF